ncbi:MAG: CopG family transcriptional regulator [Proteobacteria bacterium]|nr:MAG: CopG family transcriptional regulator [Pseudomonadota bacterium]
MSEDFSQGKRGAVVGSDPNKVRITIRLDGDIISHFKELVHQSGGGNYQTLINEALRGHIKHQNQSLERTLRKVIRDELQEFKQAG